MRLLSVLFLSIGLMTVASAAETKPVVATPAVTKADAGKPVENDNCVKKDKKGKCPPPPKGNKPTPKKKVETPK
jgi:hypothetical protein